MPELNENNVVVTNLGRVTAYADAVSAGYRGTREQFAQDQANFAQNAQLARTSAESAKTSADNAKASETITENNKIASESFTHGGTGSRAGEDVDNSQYYYEQCKAASEGIVGALIPMGTLAFEDVPPVSTLANGWMYNISNDFVTTDDFVQGAGYQQTLGTNIYVLTHNGEKKFDILAGTPVTGIKGEKETVYRKGNVSLSAKNVGAIPIEELGDADISQIGDGTVTGAINQVNSDLNDFVSFVSGNSDTISQVDGNSFIRIPYTKPQVPAGYKFLYELPLFTRPTNESQQASASNSLVVINSSSVQLVLRNLSNASFSNVYIRCLWLIVKDI